MVRQHLGRVVTQRADAILPAHERTVVVVEDAGVAAALAALLRVRGNRRPREVGRRLGHEPQARAITRQPLVPPKPKELLITVSSGLSMRLRTIGMSAKAGSRLSMWALSAAKPLLSISSE